MAHHDIFRWELAMSYPMYGTALWDPSPGPLYEAVEVGDVGYIRGGRFHRLFNALLPKGHPSHQIFGTPKAHEPIALRIQQHIDIGSLSPNAFQSSRVCRGDPSASG